MNPFTIRLYDVNRNHIVTQFLDMCTSCSSRGEGIYSAVDGKLKELLQCSNPWVMCTSLGVDNTSVNVGNRDSLKTRSLTE